jgi:hypothetical protein
MVTHKSDEGQGSTKVDYFTRLMQRYSGDPALQRYLAICQSDAEEWLGFFPSCDYRDVLKAERVNLEMAGKHEVSQFSDDELLFALLITHLGGFTFEDRIHELGLEFVTAAIMFDRKKRDPCEYAESGSEN